MATLGEIIKQYRVDKKLSMQAFADKSGLSKGYVSMLENNYNPISKKEIIPSVDTIFKTALALEMPFETLFDMISEQLTKTPLDYMGDDLKLSDDDYINYLINSKQEDVTKSLKHGKDIINDYMISEQKKEYKDVDYPNYKNILIYDCVSCGLGSFVDDEIIDFIPIPTSRLSSHYDYFAQTAKGDSMINKNIYDGDIIIFRKTVTLNNGDIGCFCVDDNNAICKVFQHDKSSNLVILSAANENYSPIIITEHINFRILGQLEFILQDLKNRY